MISEMLNGIERFDALYDVRLVDLRSGTNMRVASAFAMEMQRVGADLQRGMQNGERRDGVVRTFAPSPELKSSRPGA